MKPYVNPDPLDMTQRFHDSEEAASDYWAARILRDAEAEVKRRRAEKRRPPEARR